MHNRLSLVVLGLFISLVLFNYAGAAPTIVPCAGTGTLTCGFINVTNTTLDVGQNTIITINGISGGAPGVNGYTANWILDGYSGTPIIYSKVFANTIAFRIVPSTTLAGNVFVYNGTVSSANSVANGAYGEGTNIYTVNAAITDQPGANSIVTNDIPLLTINLAFSSGNTNPSGDYDEGQTVNMIAYAYNGTPPYTYNFLICPSGGCSTIIANSLVVTSATSNTFAWVSNQVGTGFLFIAHKNDSASTPEFASGVQPFTVDSTPAVTLTPSNNPIDAGQTETYTIAVSGGTGPFTAELYNVSGSAQVGSNVIISSPGGSNTVSFVTVATGSTFRYNAIVTDLGTVTPYTFNSATNSITINSAPAVTFTASNTVLDQGQTSTLTATISGGTPPYTVKFIYNGIIANTVSTSSNTANFLITPGAGSYSWNVVVIDNTPVTFNSFPPLLITVYPALVLTITPTNTILDQGQVQTAQATITGGTGSFLTNVTGSASPTALPIFTNITGANIALSFLEGVIGNGFNVFWFVTDTGTTTPYVFSTKATYTVGSQPVISITPSAPSITQGQTENLAIKAYSALGAQLTNYNIKVFGPKGQVGSTLTGNGTISFQPQPNATYTVQFADANTVLNYTRVSYLPSNADMIPRLGVLTNNVSLPSGYPLYICAGADGNTGMEQSWTQDSNAPSTTLSGLSPSSIGHQSSALCTFTQNTVVNGAGETALAGIAMFNTSKYTLFSSNSIPGGTTAQSLSYTVSTSGSFTVLGVACGELGCRTIRLPSGCAVQQYVNTTDSYATALIAACASQSAGTYSVNESSPSTSRVSMAAYVFAKAPKMFKVAANTSGGNPCGSGGCTTGGGVGNTTTTTVTTTTTTTTTTTIRQINVTGSPANVTINITSNGTVLNLNNNELLLMINASRHGPAKVIIIKLPVPTTPPGPANFTQIEAYNVSVNSTLTPKPQLTVTMTLQYNCSIPSSRIAPYMLVNGTWTKIVPYSVNANACTVTFSIPADPDVSLFESPAPVTTTIATTSAATTSVTQLPSQSGNADIYIVAIIIIVIIIAIVAYAASRKKRI